MIIFTEFKDLDQNVEPLLRPGIQCLLQWLNSPEGGRHRDRGARKVLVCQID